MSSATSIPTVSALCGCACGQPPAFGRQYVKGHNMRTPEARARRSAQQSETMSNPAWVAGLATKARATRTPETEARRLAGLRRPATRARLAAAKLGRRGSLSNSWTGLDVQYTGAHDRARRDHGSASRHRCVTCGGPAADWALQWDLAEQAGRLLSGTNHGRPAWHSPDPQDYSPMCKLHHRQYDRAAESVRGA